MINRGLLRQAQQARDEAQRKAEQARIDSFQQRKLAHLKDAQTVLGKIGFDVAIEDMEYTYQGYSFNINHPITLKIDDYPFIVRYEQGNWYIKIGDQVTLVDGYFSRRDVDEPVLQDTRARFADMLDTYDKTRAEALEQFKAEFPKLSEPVQDETLDDLSVQVDEAFYELVEGVMGASPELQQLVGKVQKAWREFSKRALAAPMPVPLEIPNEVWEQNKDWILAQWDKVKNMPYTLTVINSAESIAPARHPDFEEWYQTLEGGEDVAFPYITVYLDDKRTARFVPMGGYSVLKDAKQALADLQNAIALAEQWNKDQESNNDGIGWNDHHEGK